MDEKHIELFKYLGIDPEFEELDEVKTAFESTYVKTDTLGDRKDLLKPHFGKAFGEVDTAAKRMFKGLGVELKADDIKDKSTKEILELGQERLSDLITKKEAESGQTDDKKFLALQEQHETLKTDYNSVKSANEKLGLDFEAYKLDAETKSIEKERSIAKDSLWSGVKWADTVPKHSRIGFRAEIEQTHVFKFAEDGTTLEVRDKKTNEKITNPNKAGAFYEPAELLQAKAVEEKLWQLSPEQNGKAKPTGSPTQAQATPSISNGRPTRAAHPNAG